MSLFYLKKILTALALPPGGPLLLIAAGLLLARRPLGRRLAALGAMLMLLASMPPVADTLIGTLETTPPISAEGLGRAQAIVVLAGGTYHDAPEYGGDTVNRYSLERIRYAALLQRQSGLPLLVTGGAPSGGRPEAESMATALRQEFGVPVRWIESASLDTIGNAALSAPLLRAAGVDRIALVSSAYHLPRAIELFERQGFVVIPAPTCFTTRSPAQFERMLPSASALLRSRTALHEWLGRLMQ